MYNATVNFNDIMTEIKVLAMCELKGVKTRRAGRGWDLIGMTEDVRNIVLEKADRFVAW